MLDIAYIIHKKHKPLKNLSFYSVISRLKERYAHCHFEIVHFETKGDRILDVALPKIGDKGLFTKELECALAEERVDFVVHSLKDMPCQALSYGDKLCICGVPTREDPRDALVVATQWRGIKHSLDDLANAPSVAVVGTSSLRRIAQLKRAYPSLRFESIRGNLQTRFAKLDADVHTASSASTYDAIVLAVAGLRRMNLENRITQVSLRAMLQSNREKTNIIHI